MGIVCPRYLNSNEIYCKIEFILDPFFCDDSHRAACVAV